jgi:hypothetical protein
MRALGRWALGIACALAAGFAGAKYQQAESRPQAVPFKTLSVPKQLLTRTAVEPSGLVWSKLRNQYLVVSDDTGFGAEHTAPWLLGLNTNGSFAAAPIRLSGVQGAADIESIALLSERDLFILSSQSLSKTGDRSDVRQLFVHLNVKKNSLTRVNSTHIYKALKSFEPSELKRLGLGIGIEKLDIEGMALDEDGGLLLGLKSPVDKQGKAIIWKVRSPKLLAKRGLRSEDITRVGAPELTVSADGKRVPGGVSELLRLPDGTLLLASTASDLDPETQSGALYLSDKGSVKKLRTFKGEKPEGLAYSNDGRSIVVSFDRGAQVPAWTIIPLPLK